MAKVRIVVFTQLCCTNKAEYKILLVLLQNSFMVVPNSSKSIMEDSFKNHLIIAQESSCEL
jgi:hypothetical protein